MSMHSLKALVELLHAQPRVWIRLAAIRPDEEWRLVVLEVTLGEPPPSWRRERWMYPRASFIASAPAGRTVAGWLMHGRISLRSLSLSLECSEHVRVERRDSRFMGLFEGLQWPTREWTVNVQGESWQVLNNELVAGDSPVFLNFEHAAEAFFKPPPSPHRNFSGCNVVIREQDRRARIDSVLVRPTEVVVSTCGQALSGTFLTLGGDGASKRRLSQRTREVRLPVPDGLEPGAWIALHRNHELIDRRILDASWGGKDFDVEVEALTRVQVLISGGEGMSTEFKVQLPNANPVKSMKTIAAFANGAGGTILFGVRDDGEVMGLDGECTRENIDRLANMIGDWIHPRIPFMVELVDVDGTGVIIVDIPAGADPPYGVGTSDNKLIYYVRRGSNSFPATPADVRGAVRSRIPATPATPYPRGRR